jgi:signal transduction histidine kinase
MDRLINAILKLSREGRRTLAPEQLDMNKVIDDIVGSMSHRIDEANVAVTVERPLPDIRCDRVAVEQIFSNLIENAVKYQAIGRPGVIRIRGEASGARVTYEVIDNGRGIDPKDHQRIFDLFRRAGAQDLPGEGIGLAQVRALIHRLGGWIEVDSKLGEGSTFRLNLPITYVDEGNGE